MSEVWNIATSSISSGRLSGGNNHFIRLMSISARVCSGVLQFFRISTLIERCVRRC